jgi:hypothetical protein
MDKRQLFQIDDQKWIKSPPSAKLLGSAPMALRCAGTPWECDTQEGFF